MAMAKKDEKVPADGYYTSTFTFEGKRYKRKSKESQRDADRNAGDSYEDISMNLGHGSIDFTKRQYGSDSDLRRQITRDNLDKYMEERERKQAEWRKKQEEENRATFYEVARFLFYLVVGAVVGVDIKTPPHLTM